ncbi:MAG: aldehyde dehydrogenase family protein [Acidobacteriota bacterium]
MATARATARSDAAPSGAASGGAGGDAVRRAREAGATWSRWPVAQRLGVIRRLRRRLAERPLDLAATATLPWRSCTAETLTAEVLPLLDACRFLEKRARSLLAPRRPGLRGRPAWLFGSHLEIRREPLGVVLVIGPSNYPILLAGVQLLQALVAGNAVVVKPGRDGFGAMRLLGEVLSDCGLPEGAVQVLPEEIEGAVSALAEGVDKVVLTGSHSTGRTVMRTLAETATPAVMELSGCDAVVVRADADEAMAADAVAFGMGLNGGFTCIAPRRLLVDRSVAEDFVTELSRRLAGRASIELPAETAAALAREVEAVLSRGGRLLVGGVDPVKPLLLAGVSERDMLRIADIPAPCAAIFEVSGDDEALARISGGRFRLGASIFGEKNASLALARRVDSGVVVVNDVIVPTADPRAPFGGRGASGFGVTRGAEGLLEMTVTKTLVHRSGRLRPHYDPVGDADTPLFESFIQLCHGPRALRLGALGRLMKAGREKTRAGAT